MEKLEKVNYEVDRQRCRKWIRISERMNRE